ncbi:MFS transporter [Pseudomonas sp. FW300-N1A1]|nr:MFS transporter [Pseudomonas sp. FW300-N1A1]POA17330.1 MFS transporter [Pseudomonas sp. FW300-N1A1]
MSQENAAKRNSDRYWVLFAVCAAGLILPLEYTGPAMALPAIERALGGSPIALAWVINAFALSFGSSVMVAGALADRYGRKRIFCIGIASFTGFSLVIGLSPNVLVLDLLRVAQGIGAALAMSGGAASLAQEFQGRARTKAFSLLGTAFGIGLASGPVIAGALVESFGWWAIFLLGAIIGGAVLLLGVPRMRETRDPQAHSLDWLGSITFTAFLLFLTFAIMQIPQSGLGSGVVVGLLVGSGLLLVAFILVELKHERPMLDLSLFGYPRFVGIQLLPIATAVCFIVLLIILPLRLIGPEGMSELQAGAMMIALSAPMAVIPFTAALLTRWVSASTLSCVGLVIAAVGLVWLSTVPVGEHWSELVLPLLVIGMGTGLPWGLMDDLSISVVPVERAGMATGIFTTMRACGEAICVAGALALLNSFLRVELWTASGQNPSLSLPISVAANGMATGDMSHARSLTGQLQTLTLEQLYSAAFANLLYVLIAITLLAAAISALALRQTKVEQTAPQRQPL